MSTNSHLHDTNPDSLVSALRALVDWIDREGSTARGLEIVRTLARHDLDALASGQEPEPCDAAQLVARWRLPSPGDKADFGALVRKAKPVEALERRRASLRQYLDHENVDLEPEIDVLPGGGRGNTSRYRLRWNQLSELDADPPVTGDAVVYRAEPARAAFWLRWLLNERGFSVRLTSFRTWAFMALSLIPAAFALVLSVAVVLLLLAGRRDLNTAIFVTAAAPIAWLLWREGLTTLRAPYRRTIAAPTSFLSLTQMHGQILFRRRAIRDNREVKVRLIRLWATCPECGGDVDLVDGGAEFPDRLVGRCGDAPGEHIFSFDPTTMGGHSLRA